LYVTPCPPSLYYVAYVRRIHLWPHCADPHDYDGPEFDWPPYREIREDDETIEHVRRMYASLLTMCDAMLGRVLDLFDKHDLWKDTMLIVNTE